LAYDIAPNRETRPIYPRVADGYRGRIRGLDFWDTYYYYTCKKTSEPGGERALLPRSLTKHIINSDTDWIFIPVNVFGEGGEGRSARTGTGGV